MEGHWIVEFISCRAKNYGYRLNMGQVMCKVRWFSLNYRASKMLNLNSMRDALQCWMKGDEAPELVTKKHFSRTLQSGLQQEESFGKF